MKVLRLDAIGIYPKYGKIPTPAQSPRTNVAPPAAAPSAPAAAPAPKASPRSAPVAKPTIQKSSSFGKVNKAKEQPPTMQRNASARISQTKKATPQPKFASTGGKTTPKKPVIPVAPVRKESSSSSEEEEEDLFNQGSSGTNLDTNASEFTGIDLSDKSEEVQREILKSQKKLKKKQMDALKEIEERKEAEKKKSEEKEKADEKWAEKIKVWSEENGVKRSLQALLASLQNVLWEDAGWKPVSIADLMNDSKVKINYFKASRVYKYIF